MKKVGVNYEWEGLYNIVIISGKALYLRLKISHTGH